MRTVVTIAGTALESRLKASNALEFCLLGGTKS